MVLVVFKSGYVWDVLDLMFKIQAATFQRMVVRYVETVGKIAFKLVVENKQEYIIMTQMISETTCFKIFPEALFTTDVTFQQFNRSTAFIDIKQNCTTVASTTCVVLDRKLVYYQTVLILICLQPILVL